jgi:hypothetical protein
MQKILFELNSNRNYIHKMLKIIFTKTHLPLFQDIRTDIVIHTVKMGVFDNEHVLMFFHV